MKTNLTEGKFLIYTTLAVLLLMATHVFQPQISTIYNPKNYVGFHTLLESFSISISASIMLYGLKKFGATRSSRMLLLGVTFFLVGTLDLLHTLSFKGMPYFITESSIAKATWFWISARLIQSLLIFSILLIPDRILKRDYRAGVLSLGLIIVFLIGFSIINYENSLPLLVVEGRGTTLWKNGLEYIVSLIQFGSLMVALFQYHIEKREEKLAIALAFVFLLLTELIFTIYQSVFDLDNFSGHIFKAFGFYFILKSFYFSPSPNHENLREQDNEQLLKELPGFVFKAAKKGNQFILTVLEGNMLSQIDLYKEEVINRSLTEVFSSSNGTLNEYCHLSLRLQENIRFEMEYMEKSLLISIKPAIDEDEKETIIGTVIDMTGIHQLPVPKRNQKVEINNLQKIVM
ncbi:MASE3 domain-containing protein [Neobacillus drentensis]|uniref:MASE3 domain-containing protein n=1 Tax=Neobacillus drentensis TaxID=220684 RepID=UPI0030004965